jgi:hypothetical protein
MGFLLDMLDILIPESLTAPSSTGAFPGSHAGNLAILQRRLDFQKDHIQRGRSLLLFAAKIRKIRSSSSLGVNEAAGLCKPPAQDALEQSRSIQACRVIEVVNLCYDFATVITVLKALGLKLWDWGYQLSGSKQLRAIYGVAAAVLTLVLGGCGTAINSPSASSSGKIQPQSQPTTGPVLGYVWDAPSQSLHPVQGLPGASIVGAATLSASGRGAAFVASASSAVSGMALFLDANGGVFQAPLSGGAPNQGASIPGANALTLSNSGSYGLITGKSNSGANIASVISGLPQSPTVHSLAVSALGSIAGGAASDTGSVALAAGSSQPGESVVAFSGQGSGVQVATAQSFGGMQFVPGSDELIIADGGTGALTAVSHINTAPASANLAPPGAITSPVSLDITPNGRWVVAANHAGQVLRIDLTGAAAATNLHCSCAPSQVQTMRGSASGTTVRLVTSGGGPLWIVDAGGAAPRVLFIPAFTSGSVPTIVTKSAM